MPEDCELTVDEREEIESQLPQAFWLAGLDEQAPPAPGVIVRTVNELVRELRAERSDEARAAELAVPLGFLLGEQWRREFGWEWRVLIFGENESYGLVPADRRFVYLPLQDLYELFVREDDELNLMLLFNLVSAGSLPEASERQYVPLG